MPASWGLRNAFVFVDTPGPHDPAQDSIGATPEKSHSGLAVDRRTLVPTLVEARENTRRGLGTRMPLT